MCIDYAYNEDANGEKEYSEVPEEQEYDDPENWHEHNDGANATGTLIQLP